MEEKKCLWCERVFEMPEGRVYRFCDSCLLNINRIDTRRKYPIQCLEEILLKAEGLKMEDNK